MFLLNKLKLGQKIGFGFGLISFILIGVLIFSYFGMKSNDAFFSKVNTISHNGDDAGRIQANFLLCRIAFKTLLLEKDLSQEVTYKDRYNNVLNFIADYKNNEKDSNNLIAISNIEELIKQYNTEFEKVLLFKNDILSGKSNVAINESVFKMDEIGPDVADKIEALKLSLLKQEDTLDVKYKTNLNVINLLMLIFAVLGGILAVIISVTFTRFILRPILTLTDTFKKISEGDTDMSVRLKATSSDEIGKMSGHFNLFMQKLEAVFDEIKMQNMIKTRQAELDEVVRGEQSIDVLSKRIINYVCNFFDAYIGAIYVKTEDENYDFRGGYAKNNEGFSFANKINHKDGIAGQSIEDKAVKMLDHLPENYFKIKSGLGEATPKSLIVFPCIIADEVVCVLEMGSFHNFSKENIEILKSISDIIAIGINTSISRGKINELYQQTLQQTEELQVQQEELMQSHEELTEQTNALIEKENQLQVQQEELRVTNSELEERNNDLERQQNEIVQKNTDLERAKEELTEKAKALQLSNKYKSEFLANVSHELKTPLNSILVLSELLTNKTDNAPLNQKEMEYAKTINNSGAELLSIITDILDLAKVEAGKIDINKDNISFSELTTYFKNNFEQIAQSKNLEFSIKCNCNADFIYTDELRLKQIMKNLLSNAFKFTEKGGVELIINQNTEENKEKFSFTVKDTGIGIEKSKLDIVFEAFKQANGNINRKYGGTGLGLSISKQLSQLLGGDLTVESEPDKGSAFTLILPANDSVPNEIKAELMEIKPKEIKPENISLGKEEYKKVSTILIVEDDEIFSNVLKEYALGKGLNVLVAYDGNTGLKFAKESHPDAIILDIGLPDMSGVDILEQLEKEEKTKSIPVHIISGYDNKDILNQKSVFSFLKKPVTVKQIQKVFNELQSLNIKSFKNVLMIGVFDNEVEEALKNKQDIVFKNASSAKEAYSLIKNENFDCMILDKQLEDVEGTKFLDGLFKEGKLNMPVIIYTDKQITIKEEEELSKYSDSIIIRGTKSLDRLISETDIFLYNLNENAFKRKSKGKTNKLIEEDKLVGKKVLIVDDDVRNIFSITGILENKGIEVVVARNGREGIEKFNHYTDIDLILMDIMMPVIDGYETIREIRKIPKGINIPIIAITAKSMAEDRAKCIEAGADDYTTKPVDVEKLISLLRVWLYK